jgi:hypothetical protein
MFQRKYEQKYQFLGKLQMSASLPSQRTKNAATLTVLRTRRGEIFTDIFDKPVDKLDSVTSYENSGSRTHQQPYVTEIPYRNRLFFEIIAHPVDDPAVHVTVRPPVDCILQPTYRLKL